jgi:hypothetical protein
VGEPDRRQTVLDEIRVLVIDEAAVEKLGARDISDRLISRGARSARRTLECLAGR